MSDRRATLQGRISALSVLIVAAEERLKHLRGLLEKAEDELAEEDGGGAHLQLPPAPHT